MYEYCVMNKQCIYQYIQSMQEKNNTKFYVLTLLTIRKTFSSVLPVAEMDTNLLLEKYSVDEIRGIEKNTR